MPWSDNAFPLGFPLFLVSSLFSQTETEKQHGNENNTCESCGRCGTCQFVFREVLSQISMGFHLPTHRPIQFHVNLMSEMTEFPPDGVADCGTRGQGTLQVCQLPFDPDRARTFVTVPLLISVFHICRYQWSERGVFVYLTFQEQTQVALVNWSAWNETSERRSDDLFNLSPAARNHAGMVHYQIA